MLNIVVCDDDIRFTGKFERMLYAIAEQENITADIEVLWNGAELINNICNEKKCYDLIFLDIEMKGMDGLEVARKIREIDEVALLIYVTNYKSYAIEAYEVQPFQFIVKPVTINFLYKYFKKAYEKIISGAFYFEYKYEKFYCKILVNEIMYFESKKRVIYIHIFEKMVQKFYDKLNNVEERLKNEKVDFWRIHQSYLVNTRYIRRKSYDEIELVNGKILYISEDRRKEVSEFYCDHIGGDIVE
ncbi:MAG: LytTR family DNA-binding domain-containing protein [Anaerocolumna sp.]